jgi:pectate lyase/pectin methylesterase-like acyl-CoA thioesterase
MLLALIQSSVMRAATTVTGLWDFQNMNPSSLSGLKIEGTQQHVASNNSNVQMFVIAKSGKFSVRTSDVQVNANTYLRVPVKSTSDVVTIVSYPGYYNFKINGTAATANTTNHTATASEVSNGFVEIAATATCYLYSIKVVQKVSTAVTALWDFANVNPSALSGLAIEGKQGHIPSTIADIDIYCIGQYGKFAQRTSDAQFNAKTTLRVPVTSTSDVVTVTSCTGYHNYAVGGTAATADVTTHTATSSEVSQGYVIIYGTGASYLKSIKAVLNNYTGSGQATSSTSSSSTSSSSSSSSSTTTTDNTTTASGNFTAVSQNYYIVSAGSASGFLSALSKANSSTSSGRKYIFLPDGTYDLGTTCLTAITGSNISIIGQSMSKTIIKNKPAVANEGISTTATLLNKGSNNYFQDLTIQNALDYYNAGSAGRAVTLQDKGNNTICKNVKLVSYQDTYYSNNASGQFYFEGCDIHGTVDFICGGGDVFFNECTLTVEKRNSDGSGSCVIAAPYTQSTWGYVFNNCTIANNAASYSLGRAWGCTPRLAYINTTLSAPTKIASTRFTAQGMNVIADKFVEYNSKNSSGSTVSPASNVVKFYVGSTTSSKETILSASAAKGYALSKVFTSWTPNEDCAQLTMSTVSQSGNTITWSKVSGASSYAIFKDSKFVAIVGSSTTSYSISATGTYSVRASNPMGGFGTAKSVTVSSLSSSSSSSSGTSSSVSGTSSYDLGAPVGWGTVGGSITGSSNKNAVVVTNSSDFISAMSGTDQKTIYVKGTISVTGQMTVQNAQNKTVYGLPGSVLANTTHTSDASKTGILYLKNCKNIILRNLTFKGAGAYDIDGKDNLTVQNCQYLWVDHCDFQDGVDGNFDCNNGSDNISVTWCRFRYLISPWAGGSGGSDDHRFSDLWGGSDKNASKDEGKLRTTFANCWWDEGCRERMPRVRFGQIHIVNCLYSSSVANYCIGAGYKSNIYVEKTAFTTSKTQKTPWKSCATSSGYTDYNITLTGCSGVSDQQTRSGSNSYFNPYSKYSYTAYDASKVQSVVSQYAGATLSITAPAAARSIEIGEEDTATGIISTDAEATVVSTQYFNARGAELPAPEKGLNIVKTTLSNGKTIVQKVMIR